MLLRLVIKAMKKRKKKKEEKKERKKRKKKKEEKEKKQQNTKTIEQCSALRVSIPLLFSEIARFLAIMWKLGLR